MRFLSGKSIRAKSSLLTCVVAFAAVAFSSLGFAGLGFYQLCDSEAEKLNHHAQLIGHYSVPVITLRNTAAGERLLGSLSRNPAIEAACLFDLEKNCISRYGSAKKMTFPLHLRGKSYRLASLNRLEVLSQIDAAGQHVGFIYLRSNTKSAQAKLAQFARGAGIIFLVVIGLCGLVAIPFKRAISAPIVRLVKTIEEISSSEHPSLDFARHSSPEGLEILGGVNRLIAKIKESDQLAERATAGLEGRVAESNHALAQELKRLHKRQQDLEQAKTSAEAASLAKSSFIADMSEQMRDPLEHIVGCTEQLLSREQAGGQATTKQLGTIHLYGTQLQSLIEDVAEIAMVEAGRVEIERVPCLPEAIIGDTVAGYQSQADAKGLAFEYRWRGSGEEMISCDPERLRQIVGVLVSNAIRFTDSGGVRVAARLDRGRESGHLCIEVTDTGVGIDTDCLEQVFAPSVEPTRIAQEGETLIGLHNCRKIVTALGGQITVNSSVGEGTVFTVTIDASQVSAASPQIRKRHSASPGSSQVAEKRSLAPSREAFPSSASADSSESQPPRILVVDDSDTNRDLTQLVLRRAGARVEGAENGLEAVQVAVRESFDLIFMDMQMPVMDGYSATREIRAQGIEVPIIALTAYAMEFDEQKCRAAGCIGHLTKPVDTEVLLRAAERVLPWGKKLTRDAQPVASQTAQPQAVPTKPRSPYDIDFEPQATPTA